MIAFAGYLITVTCTAAAAATGMPLVLCGTFRPRARPAADDARPDGPPPEPAPGAARYDPDVIA